MPQLPNQIDDSRTTYWWHHRLNRRAIGWHILGHLHRTALFRAQLQRNKSKNRHRCYIPLSLRMWCHIGMANNRCKPGSRKSPKAYLIHRTSAGLRMEWRPARPRDRWPPNKRRKVQRPFDQSQQTSEWNIRGTKTTTTTIRSQIANRKWHLRLQQITMTHNHVNLRALFTQPTLCTTRSPPPCRPATGFGQPATANWARK